MKKMTSSIPQLAALLILGNLFCGPVFAAGGLNVSRDTVVDASAATVWKLIGNFNAIDVWHPVVVSSDLSGNGTEPESVRVLTLGDGATVTEPLVSYDADEFSYTYAITESPLPIENYEATISLSVGADGKTVMTWEANFDAAGASDEEVKEIMTGIYDAGLAKVASIFKQ